MIRQGVSFKGSGPLFGARLVFRGRGYSRVSFVNAPTKTSPFRFHPTISTRSLVPQRTTFTRRYSNQPIQQESLQQQKERLSVYKQRFEESIKDEQDEAKREQAKKDFLDSKVADRNQCYFFWSVAKEEDFTVLKVTSPQRINGMSLYHMFGSNFAIVFLSYKCSFLNAKHYLEKDPSNQYTQYLVTLKEDAQRILKEFQEHPSGIVVSRGDGEDREVIELERRVKMVLQKQTQYVPVIPLYLYPKQKHQKDVNIDNKEEFSYFYRDRLQDILEHSIPPYLVYTRKKFLPQFRENLGVMSNPGLEDLLEPYMAEEDEGDLERDVKLHAALTEAKKNGKVEDELLQQIVSQLGVSEGESKRIIRDVKTSDLLSEVLNEDFEEEGEGEEGSVAPEETETTEEGQEEETEESSKEETTSSEDSSFQLQEMKLQQRGALPPALPHYLNSFGLKVPYTADIPHQFIAHTLTELLQLDYFKEFLSLFNFSAYISEPYIHDSGSLVFIAAEPSFRPGADYTTKVKIVQEKLAQLFNVPQSKFDIYWRRVSEPVADKEDQFVPLPKEVEGREQTLTGISINDIVPPFDEETSFDWSKYDSFLKERMGHWVKDSFPAPQRDEEL